MAATTRMATDRWAEAGSDLVAALLRPGFYAGAVREAALTAVHLAAYPLGLVPGALPTVLAAERTARSHLADDPEAAHLPVILVHGLVHNASAFLLMARALRRAGFRHVHTFNYSPFVSDLNAIAEVLGQHVERIMAATGARRCTLVGHSVGGLAARHYVHLLGGAERVDTVITIGTPHQGTCTAYLGLGLVAAELRPGSAYLRRLDASSRADHVRWIAYHADSDLMVTPARNARLVAPALAATNIAVHDTGHLSLLLSSSVVRGVVAHLADRRLDGAGAADPRGRPAQERMIGA